MAQAIILILLSGLLYRVRGSSWTDDDAALKGLRVAKLAVGSLPLPLAALHLGINPPTCAAVWIVTALADTLPHAGNQGAVDIGQALRLIPNAIASAFPVVAALFVGDHRLAAYVAAVSVVLIAPAYFIGNRLPIYWMIGPIGFRKGPEIGEVIYGLTRCLFVLAGLIIT